MLVVDFGINWETKNILKMFLHETTCFGSHQNIINIIHTLLVLINNGLDLICIVCITSHF